MKIIKGYPPNYKEIRGVLPAAREPGVLFCYGDCIYNPSGEKIPPWLIKHEEVHERQQAAVGGPEAWWRMYLTDPAFRYAQELEAHVVEWAAYKDKAPFPTRKERERYLEAIARRLSSRLYGGNGGVESYTKALAEITTGSVAA